VTRHLAARRAAVAALATVGLSPSDRAAQLEAAAAALKLALPDGDEAIGAIVRRGYLEGLRALAELEHWEIDTLSAGVDAERHRRAAVRRAELAVAERDPDDPLSAPLTEALSGIAKIASLDERHTARATLLAVPLTVPLIDPPRSPIRARRRVEDPPALTPRGVVITAIDGSPVTDRHVVTPGQVHGLQVEARVLDWPEDADRLVVRYPSRWPRSAAEATDVVINRPAEAVDGVWTGKGEGHLVLHAGARDPLSGVRFVINSELVGEEVHESLALLGLRELTIRTFDPAHDVMTGAPVLDERILAMLAEVRELAIAPDEQPAFGRFLGAIARAGVRIIAERVFPIGSNPTETQFQAELLKRVSMATELGGRVAEHAWQGGGETDLAHDGVVAELKVERSRAATLENAKAYLAQTTQYASAGHRQLSILVILDMTIKDAPPGVLANTVGWLVPELHGLTDPAYPSRVAVVIVNGNLPVPSAWSP